MGLNAKEVGEQSALKVYNQHRTLQQSFWRVIRELMVSYSANCEKYGTDLRNESAADFVKKAVKATDECYFPCI